MLANFFQKYFIQPILSDGGFNVVDTLVYAALAIVILYVLFLQLKDKVKFDFDFFLAMAPFIVFGSVTRAFMDHDYFGGSDVLKFLFYTPGIYLVTASLFLGVLGISLLLQKRYAYWKICLSGGIIANAIVFGLAARQIGFDELSGLLGLVLFAGIVAATYFILRKRTFLTEKLPFLTICAQLFDAVNTFVIVQFFGGWEKHPLPRLLIEHFSPASFLVVKLVVVLAAVYFIRRDVKDVQLRNYILMSIAVLGFAQGLRNVVSLVLA